MASEPDFSASPGPQPKSQTANPNNDEEDDNDDDYMTMSFTDPAPAASAKETSLQRRQREKREGEARGKPKSKAERQKEEELERERALETSALDESSKGFRMMAKLGFKGGKLGANTDEEDGRGLQAPIRVEKKEDRGGIGMESEKKRKLREAFDEEMAKQKSSKVKQEDYVERVRVEREVERTERMVWAAMKVAEGLEDEENQEEGNTVDEKEDTRRNVSKHQRGIPKRLSDIPVVWRRLAKQRLEKAQTDMVKKHMLSRKSYGEDSNEERDKAQLLNFDMDDLDDEDAELDKFESLEAHERLATLVVYLRDKFNYCFWCKYRYPDKDMDGCPGLTEEEHD